MNTFDLILEDQGVPWWATILVFIGFALLTALTITAQVKFEKRNSGGIGASLFLVLSFLLVPFTLMSPVAMGQVNEDIQQSQIVQRLSELEYDNIDLKDGGSLFVASKDGNYIAGDILEKSYTELVVVIRSE